MTTQVFNRKPRFSGRKTLHADLYPFGLPYVSPPVQQVTYLGIRLDSNSMTLSLPSKKVQKLKDLITEFSGRHESTVRDFHFLVDHLAHARSVVRGGRTFSCRVINLLKYVGRNSWIVVHPLWLRDDLQWWLRFIDVFNGSGKIILDIPELAFPRETDSSMTGFAGKWGHQWFLGVWHSPFPPLGFPIDNWEAPLDGYHPGYDINILELLPVVVAARRWGDLWNGHKIRLYTDNTQVMSMINTGRSTSTACMFRLRELFWLSVIFNFQDDQDPLPGSLDTVLLYLSFMAQTLKYVTIINYLMRYGPFTSRQALITLISRDPCYSQGN